MAAPTATTWQVELEFVEDRDQTEAEAIVHAPDGRELHGHGTARRNPTDRPARAIGEEVAGARALSALAHELLGTAAHEIEDNVHGDRQRV